MMFTQEAQNNPVKIVCSNPFGGAQYTKITLRPVQNNGARLFHIEKLTKTQAFHENVAQQDVSEWLQSNVQGLYKQICLFFPTKR